MNTKGIKFLAVLAVLAMAFAVFAVSEQSDAEAKDILDFDKEVDFSHWSGAGSLSEKSTSNAKLGNVLSVKSDLSGNYAVYTVTGYFGYVNNNDLVTALEMGTNLVVAFNMTIPAGAYVFTATSDVVPSTWQSGKLATNEDTVEPNMFNASTGIVKWIGYAVADENGNAPSAPTTYAKVIFGTEGTYTHYGAQTDVIVDKDTKLVVGSSANVIITKNVTIADVTTKDGLVRLGSGNNLFVAPGVTLTINASGASPGDNTNSFRIIKAAGASTISGGVGSKIVINDTTTLQGTLGDGKLATLAIEADGKLIVKDIALTISQTVTGGAGIVAKGVDIDNATVKITAGNRAIYDHTSTGVTIKNNSNVEVSAKEYGIRTIGALTVGTTSTDKTTVTAKLIGQSGNNNPEEYYGIKSSDAVTINDGSTITTDGMLIVLAGKSTVNGTLNVKYSAYAGYTDKSTGVVYQPAGLVVVDKIESKKITTMASAELEISSTGKVIVSEGAAILGKITSPAGTGESAAGSVTFGAIGTASDYVPKYIVVSSDATFKHGSVVIDGDFTTNADGSITINSGVAKISGELNVALTFGGDASLVVVDGETLTIGENGSINTTNGTFTINKGGVLGVAGTLTGAVTNNGELDLLTGGNIKDVTIGGTGEVIDKTDDDDMKELVIGGESEGKDTTFTAKQKVIVSSELGYWTLNKDSKVVILGALVIPEGTIMTVQAGAELEIDNEAKVYVYGELVIDGLDGTVPAGIFDVITGTVSVEGDATLNGTLTMGYAANKVTEIDVEDGGSFVIGETGSFTLTNNEKTEFFVAEGGELTVYGTMGAVIWNSGLVTIDSEVPVTTATTIYMWTAGATVDVENYTVRADKTDDAKLTISDLYMIFTTYKDSKGKDVNVILKDAEDKIVIGMEMKEGASADYSITFSGIEVVSGSTSTSTTADNNADAGIYSKKQYSKYLDVSGNFFVDYEYIGTTSGTEKTVGATVTSTTETGDLAAFCGVRVSEEIDINDNITLRNAAGVLTVTGTIDSMSETAKVANAGIITLADAGYISSIKNAIDSETGINAARFVTLDTDSAGKTIKVYNYYTIDGALAAVTLGAETTEIIILGTQTMKLSAVLPDGVTLVLSNISAVLNINSDVAFTVNDMATLKGEGTVYVNGSMYAEEKTQVKSGVTIISDVKTEELDEKGKPTKNGWAMWTNLASAIAAAEPGSVVTVTKTDSEVIISSNMVIPEGIALAIPQGTVGILLKNGVTLTIDGIVIVGSNIYAEQAFGLNAQSIKSTNNNCRYSSAIVVNGALISTDEIKYGNGAAAGETASTTNEYKVALIGGTYAAGRVLTFNGADPSAKAETSVTAPIAGAYYTMKGGSNTYYVISSLEFAAQNIESVTNDIKIHGDVSALTLEFAKTDDFSKITIKADNVTAPTSIETNYKIITELTVATLVLDEVSLVSEAGAAYNGIVGNGTDAMTFVDVSGMTVLDKSNKLYVYGNVDADAEDAGAVVSAGAVYLGYSNTAFAFDGIDTDAKIANYLTIADGAEAIAENCGNVDLMRVEGTFKVPANKTASVTQVLIDLGVVDVAATTETTAKGILTVTGKMYVGCDASPAAITTEFAVAYLNGPINFGDKTGIFVMDDAVVDLYAAACLLALNKSTTFYVEDEEVFTMYAKGTFALDLTPLTIPEAKVSGWVDENGKAVTSGNVGDHEELYASIDYNIYQIVIITDAGVKSVAINGIELVSDGGNKFVTNARLIAGTYKVTYTLKAGYQEDKNGVTLYTDDGTVLKDRSFVASGAIGDETITLQLSGTEIIPEPEPVTPEEQSEWTITTILLVVLVILIAIMAVIVALRLNRN